MNATVFKRANKFSKRTTIADAAVTWQALPEEQVELVIVDGGLPYLAGVPELTERAEALLEAAQSGDIDGITHNEDGYPIHPDAMRLDRASVERWIATTQVAMQEVKQVQPTELEERLLSHEEVLARLNVSASTLHRMIRAGKFSAAHAQGPKRWKQSYVNAYVAAAGEDI